MRLRAYHWPAGLSLSLATHLLAATYLQALPEDFLVEGGGGNATIMLLGESVADAIAAGAPDETIQPEEVTEKYVAEVETIRPEDETVAEITDANPTETLEPVDDVRQMTEANEIVEPVVEQQIAALTSEIQPLEEATLAEARQPAEEIEALGDVPPLVNPPMPVKRPEVAEIKPAPAARTPPKKKIQKTAKGDAGSSNVNARKQAAVASTKSKSSAEGNAAVSNYPGKVASKLRRSLRYPKSAARKNGGGQAQVAFTVNASGAASSIRVVASSGSPVLDQAAVDAVWRASPFPPIPPEAGRGSWPFTVPILFKR